jgi:NAD+ diphosphatase
LVSGNDGAMRLGRLALARGELDRAAHRRHDTQWLSRAWADPRTRVLIIEDGQVLVRFSGEGDGGSADAGWAGMADGSGADGGSSGAGRAGGSGADGSSGAEGGSGDDVSSGAEGGSGGDVRTRAEGGSAGADQAELVLVSPAESPDSPRILLGVDAAGVAYFAVLGPLPDEGLFSGPGQVPGPGRGTAGAAVRAGLREVGALLGDRDAGLFTHAVALANWHATHEHCPRCGARTRLAAAGHTRLCPQDGSEHFPRVDPAVIMLVLDPADRCILARNQKWPMKRVSILAGFVEPGESVEQAVAREVREEVGISVGEFRYLGSQPWPMPQSLMLGFSARAVEDAQRDQPIRVDDDEIAEARWYSRDDLRVAIESGDILLPPPVSIAHRIIAAWYGAPLPRA